MTKTTLLQFLETGKLNGNCLLLNVIRHLGEGKYIVGDPSGLGLFFHEKEGKILKLNSSIKIVKPLKVNDMTLKCSPKLGPMKTLEKVEVLASKRDQNAFEKKCETNQEDSSTKKYTNFDEIKNMPSSSIIENVTFLVTNVSKIIQTKTGQYQICGIRDVKNTKLSINLYDKNMNKLEVGKVMSTTKLKKFQIKKNENYETRLNATKFSMFIQASSTDKTAFEHVKMADNSLDGILLGFTNIMCYKSCKEHWNKVNEENFCQACGGIAQNTQSDFKVEILLECQTEPEEVKTFMAFKKVMKMITTEECEDTVESKLAEYEGRQCTVEYDTTGDGSQIEILKKIIIVE